MEWQLSQRNKHKYGLGRRPRPTARLLPHTDTRNTENRLYGPWDTLVWKNQRRHITIMLHIMDDEALAHIIR